ncbi:MAG TPA: protein-glutamate O-methyltransferase CheR [Polyangiaceae bacterium]
MRATPQVFAILSALVQDYAGLHYSISDQELFIDRVSTRATEVGFESLLDYYYFLRYDPLGAPELEKLVESLVVGETFFFRELEPIRVIASQIVPQLLDRGLRPRIWSAACATGEEPLTLAMLLAEQRLLSKVDLVASDISARSLARAKAGRFGRRSLRDVANWGLAQRWIKEEPTGGLSVSPELIDAIDWRRLNLCDPAATAAMGPCDVILCRNVLIYFNDETLVRVLGNLSRALASEGALFVGVSESLLRFGTFFSCEERNHVFIYRKVV